MLIEQNIIDDISVLDSKQCIEMFNMMIPNTIQETINAFNEKNAIQNITEKDRENINLMFDTLNQQNEIKNMVISITPSSSIDYFLENIYIENSNKIINIINKGTFDKHDLDYFINKCPEDKSLLSIFTLKEILYKFNIKIYEQIFYNIGILTIITRRYCQNNLK